MTTPLIDPDRMAEAKSDMIDMASAHEAMNLAAALRNMPRPVIPATGECLYCAEGLPALERWCDADCRDDWTRVQERRRMNGAVDSDA